LNWTAKGIGKNSFPSALTPARNGDETARALLPDDIDEKKIQNTMINMKPEEEQTRGVADVYEKSGLS
jgi:hypothetical protein